MIRILSVRAVAVVASLITGLGALGAPSALAAFPGADGVVAVRVAGDIWLKTIGGGEEQLTFTGNNGRPHWSPDGKTLAFTRAGRIVMLNVSAGTETTVPGISDAVDLGWSGDGTQFILDRNIAGHRAAIWLVGSDGGDLTRIAHPGPCTKRGFSTPAISPDGKYIAFDFFRDRTTSACGPVRYGTRVISLVTGKRQFIPGVEGHQPSFTSDSSAVIAGIDGYESYVVRLELVTGQLTDLLSFDCQTGYSCLAGTDLGQATPDAGFAYLVFYGHQQEPYPSDTCFVMGNVSDCFHDPDSTIVGDESGYPWASVSSFDVQPVTSTP